MSPPPGPPTAWAFPGQGVDPVDTAAVLAEHHGHPWLALLAEVTGRGAWHAEDMADTRMAQPCVVVAGLLTAGPLDRDRCHAVVGHSLGEITALAFAGALDVEAALGLVARRAALGHEVQSARPGAMVAVIKLDPATVEWLRRSAVAATGGSLELAVTNGPRQVVLSGDRAAVEAVADLVVAERGVARVMGIGGAYHSPLLRHAVDAFADAVLAGAPRDPVVPFVSSTGGGVVRRADDVARVLSRALVMPVDWPAAMDLVRGLGIARAVDVGPGQTLVNLAAHTPILEVTGLRPGRR